MRERAPLAPVAYCTASTTSGGCVPSILSSGTPSTSSGIEFTIAVNFVEGQKPGIMFYGIDNSGFPPLAWGAGSSWTCLNAPVQRMGSRISNGTLGVCDGSLSIEWNTFRFAHPTAPETPSLPASTSTPRDGSAIRRARKPRLSPTR